MTGQPTWAGLVVALVVFMYAPPLTGGETRSLSLPQPVPLHSSIVASTLPPAGAAAEAATARQRTAPRHRPAPDELARLKGALSEAPPGAVTAAEAPAPSFDVSPPAAGTIFEGLTNGDNAALASPSVAPSDATLAVGPNHVFEMVNIVGRITDKSGGAASSFTLRSFFHVDPDADETDPRVIFDAASQRWFASILQFSEGRSAQSSLILAVSATSDPTGAFCLVRLGNPTAETFLADFPQLGIDDHKVIVTFDAFTFGDDRFLGAGYYAVNKAALTQAASSGCQAPSVPSVRVPPNPARFGIYPAQSLSSTGRLFMAMNGDGSTLSAELLLLAVDGEPGVTAMTETTTLLPIRVWSVPPDAVQAGSSVRLATNDASIITATWQRGSLWIGGNEGCFPSGDVLLARRSCLRLIQIQTDLLSVQQDVTFGAAGQYYYYPALSPDGAGNLFVVFNASSSGTFAGVRATGRRATDPPNALAAATLLRAGGGAQTDPSGRMGDYYGAALDPADPGRVWVATQYVRTTASRDWGTYVASLAFAPLAPPTLALTLNATTFRVGDQLVVKGTLGAPDGPLFVDVYFGLVPPAAAGPDLGCPLGDAVAFAAGSPSNFVVRCLSQSPATFPRLSANMSIPDGIPASMIPGTWLSAPAGVYVVFMAFTVPGALLHGTIEPGDIVALATVSLTFAP